MSEYIPEPELIEEISFLDEFDREACIALRKATQSSDKVTIGKRHLVFGALQKFGYTPETKMRLESIGACAASISDLEKYHRNEFPWEKASFPTYTATVELTSMLVYVGGDAAKDFLEKIRENPRRIAFQWLNYWLLIKSAFPKETYRTHGHN